MAGEPEKPGEVVGSRTPVRTGHSFTGCLVCSLTCGCPKQNEHNVVIYNKVKRKKHLCNVLTDEGRCAHLGEPAAGLLGETCLLHLAVVNAPLQTITSLSLV